MRIPPSTPVGNYVLQWYWDGNGNGNGYYSCANIVVTTNPINETVMYVGNTEQGDLEEENQYYELDRQGNDTWPLLLVGQMTNGAGPAIFYAVICVT